MNRFGKRFAFTTFGESHGEAIGAIVEGVPAGLKIDKEFIQQCLNKRKPGSNQYATGRKEGDEVQILSGIFKGVSTGTPIAMIIFNTNQKSKDYENIKDIFRPGHADFTYFHKYGIRDYRGGGRSSARESATRVAVGAVAKLMLKEFGIEVLSGVASVGKVKSKNIDFEFAKQSEIYSLCSQSEEAQKKEILRHKKMHNSVGGSVKVKATGLPIGLGEPMYYKLDGAIGEALLGLNGVKAVSIGSGIEASFSNGASNNDPISPEGFLSNHSGGVLGGISNGEDLEIDIFFKPTPSIFQPQKTIDKEGNERVCELKGRHDPCIAIRGSVVCEAMVACVLADMMLLNATSKLESLKRVYNASV